MTGFIDAMREKMVPIRASRQLDLIDLCGTGGDRKNTFNISTTASLLVSASGVSVAKHGNRSVSSKCGSADILEKLGVNINLSPSHAERCLEEIGFTFLFAPNFHPAMKNVAPVRKALGIPTVFNILGPLCNPASVKRQLIGVYDDSKRRLIAETLKVLGHLNALIVHSRDGLDEISPAQPTDCIELNNNTLSEMTIDPESLGIKSPRGIDDLSTKDIDENVRMIYSVLKGEKGSARDAVLLNAAAGLYLAGKASSLKEGLVIAGETIDSGKALNKLQEFIALSNRL
ncbi:MAG: anthranilate phosphoribosyltransferase, partial [Planctomycetota bacterium]|nr:anthranilate phosphoribosyltransferase [Planctomycetota bacterium]